MYTPSQIQDGYREDKIWARKGQTVFFTAVNPMDKEHKDPCAIDLDAPRLVQYKQNTWKRHQDSVLGRYTTCSTERIEVLSNRIERNLPLRHTPSLLNPESCCDGIWRKIIYEKVYMSPLPPPKISSKNDWMKELD